jgi:Uncharacterized protein conserved in bacteria (DUF2252)
MVSPGDESMSRARADAGRALRKRVPRSSHAVWEPGPDRAPLRVLESPTGGGFPSWSPSARPACGRRRSHLLNFGLFATPEPNLVFGLNDFDETLPGPWEWDVKRLATSFVVAARTVGFDQAQGRRAALAAVRTYREQLARYAGMRLLDVWYSRVDAATIALAHGRQVVNGQRLLQTASDSFLGWTGDGVAQYYVRQL